MTEEEELLDIIETWFCDYACISVAVSSYQGEYNLKIKISEPVYETDCYKDDGQWSFNNMAEGCDNLTYEKLLLDMMFYFSERVDV